MEWKSILKSAWTIEFFYSVVALSSLDFFFESWKIAVSSRVKILKEKMKENNLKCQMFPYSEFWFSVLKRPPVEFQTDRVWAEAGDDNRFAIHGRWIINLKTIDNLKVWKVKKWDKIKRKKPQKNSELIQT
jgi:hypothetical protein